MRDLNVLVAGAGAVGQWLGARLEQAGYGVTLWTTPRHTEALATGLVVTGLTNLSGRVRAVSDRPRGPFDVVVLTSKAHRTAALAEAAAPALARDGVFLTLQNGLGNAGKVARFVPPDRVAVGLTSHGVTLEHPGRVVHAGSGATLVGPAAGAPPDAARRAHTVLERAGLEPEWKDAMRGFVWRKAIVNAGINPLGALHGVRNGGILERKDLREEALAVVAEGVRLAGEARVGLPEGDLSQTLLSTLERTVGNKVSMLQDVEARRPTETEQILGRMVRLAGRMGVPVPRMEGLYGRMKDLEASYLGAEAALRLAQEEAAWETDPF